MTRAAPGARGGRLLVGCLGRSGLALLALACGGGADAQRPSNVTAQVAEISTVLSVAWQTSEPSIGYVEYGTTEALGSTTPIEDEPTRAQIEAAGLDPREDTLFGLYEGVPLEERGVDYVALPDKISIFYRPIVEACESPHEIRDEIRTTILHEVAHFFGIDDQDLDAWGY